MENDTVTPETLLDGYTAHDAQGEAITGTYTPPPAKAGIISGVSVVTARFISEPPIFAQTVLEVKE